MIREIQLIFIASILVLFSCRESDPTGGGGTSLHEECGNEAQSVLVEIPDEYLEREIRYELDVMERPLTSSDLCGLLTLNAGGTISAPFLDRAFDLTGIEHAINLESLSIAYNEITDISLLANLSYLDWLDITGNQIADLSPLSSLTRLQGLKVGANSLVGIDPLAQLTNLDYLYLANNQIEDISSLSELSNLKTLILAYNSVESLYPISRMYKLNRLLLQDNHIRDLTPLKNLENLTYLDLSENQIVDLSGLSELHLLEYLNLAQNQIDDLSPLIENPGLGIGDEIYLMGNSSKGTGWPEQIQELRKRGVSVFDFYGDD